MSQQNTVVRILASAESSTHLFNYTEDRILSIGINPELLKDGAEIPEYLKRTAHLPAFIPLDEEDIQVLHQMIDGLERIKPS